MDPISIPTERLRLSSLDASDLDQIRSYYLDNAQHLEPWEPLRSKDFHFEQSWAERIKTAVQDRRSGTAIRLVIRECGDAEIIGVCNFTNIVRGPFQACNLGYSLAAMAEGQGFMFEALEAAIAFVFDKVKLHRIMANHIPENERSANLLRRLGFAIEGHAKDYLHIAGEWRDHVLTAKINPAAI